MSINPYEPPSTASGRTSVPVTDTAVQLLDMVKSQRAMMWLFVARFGLDISTTAARDFNSGLLMFGFWLAYLGVSIALAYFVFRLANGVYGIGPAVVCVLLSFVPCLGTLTVLILNGNAMDRLRKMGAKVGFMGASAKQLQELNTASLQQRQSST